MRRAFRYMLAAATAATGLVAIAPAPPASAAGSGAVLIELWSSPNPSTAAETVTLSVAVLAGTPPTGQVTFRVDGVVVGTAMLDEGEATASTLIPGAGRHEVRVDYAGDDDYAAATATRAHTVASSLSRRTWVGPADGLWSTPANWEPAGVPADGDTLVLRGPGGVSKNDVAGLSPAHLSFPAGTHVVESDGQGFSVTGDVYVARLLSEGQVSVPVALPAGTHLVDGNVVFYDTLDTAAGTTVEVAPRSSVGLGGPVELGGDTTFDVGADSPVRSALEVVGGVSGAGGLVKTGPGTLVFSGSSPNTLTGEVTIDEGTVWASKGGDHDVAYGSFPTKTTVSGAGTRVVTAAEQFGKQPVSVGPGAVVDFDGGDVMGPLSVEGTVELTSDVGPDLFGVALITPSFALADGATLTMKPRGDAVYADAVSLAGQLELVGDQPYNEVSLLIESKGLAPVQGHFDGLPEDGVIQLETEQGRISYKGRDGNDITLTTPPVRSGYWMLDQAGFVYGFGDAKDMGGPNDLKQRVAIPDAVDIEPTPSYSGYWMLSASGSVYRGGDAMYLPWGFPSGFLPAGETTTSISNDRDRGYWLFTNRGRALQYGTAEHHGDMAGIPLNGPVLGSVGTPSGQGYYMVASDGGIFAFGDARFKGSMGGKPLNKPVVGLAPDPDGDGYWLVAGDGGVFAFNAPFKGSLGGTPLNKPVVGMVAYGDGYLLVGADGGIFNFSTKPFAGSLGSNPPAAPVVSVASLDEG